MVKIAVADYPPQLPTGAYHHDLDSTDVYRFPRTLEDDYYCYVDTQADSEFHGMWVIQDGILAAPTRVVQTLETRALGLLKDRRIRDLEAQVAARPDPAPAPAVQARARAPDAFSGTPNDKGMIVPSAREFARTMRAYVLAQAISGPLTNDRQMATVGTYLTGEAAQWYEQKLAERATYEEDAEDAERRGEEDVEPYNGPLASLNHLIEGLLKEFEDVNIEATAQHKLEIIHQEKETAETHVRHFKHWARHADYNDKALIGYFRRSLAPMLKKKIQNMENRPATLDGWYEQAIKFDRNWREDQDEQRNTRPAFNQPARSNTTPQQSPTPQRNANQAQPRNGQWRPWGSVAQPAQQSVGINAMPRDNRCFKCGKTDGHFARDCQTPVDEIRRTFGRDSMYQPRAGHPVQNRATNFANAGEFINSLSAEQRREMTQALQSGGAQGANQAPPPQGFASGSS